MAKDTNYPKSEFTNKNLPSKWININKFKKKPGHEKFGRHEITIFNKPNKAELWYFKIYHPRIKTMKTESESVASDLYRFILGKSRAAKSQVVYANQTALGIISQQNPAGFKSFDRFEKDFIAKKIQNTDIGPYDFKLLVNAFVAEGSCEVDMAEKFLDDIDGIDNIENVGLNANGEIARIDYDLALYWSERGWEKDIPKQIKDRFFFNEDLVIKTNDDVVIKRFYKSQLKMQLLNESVVNTIIKRHSPVPGLSSFFTGNSSKKELAKFLSANVQSLRQVLPQSEKFKAFLRDFDPKEIFDECVDFFKHEKKHFPFLFHQCLIAINETYHQIKTECLENDKAMAKIPIVPR